MTCGLIQALGEEHHEWILSCHVFMYNTEFDISVVVVIIILSPFCQPRSKVSVS